VWVSPDPILGQYLPHRDQDPSALCGQGGVFLPVNLGMYSYAALNPVKYVDPDGNAFFLPVLIFAPEAVALIKATLFVGSATAAAYGAHVMLNESNQDSGSDRPTEHGPRPLTDDEKGRLSDAGRQPDPADKSGRTKAGRAAQKHGSRPGSAFPPVSGTPEDHNQQGQDVLDGILNDPGSTVETDDRGRTTVTAPDGRGARYNPDGSLQGFREPKPPSEEQ
jgi:hypothetical protein